ncbi:MAG: hypothetical protein AAGE59_19775 [Cyanobacteria bacterium P01_F01_bin.86]
MQTLNEIASSLGVSLQTVYNRKADVEKRLGRKIEGTQHPTDKRKIIYDEEAVALITGQPILPVDTVQAVEVTVETGNHCTTLAQPNIQGTEFSLERFRSDEVQALVFKDPDAVADQFLAAADQLVAGMEADIQAREQRLKKTRVAQGRVVAKAQELKLEKRLYRDRARDLDTAQTSETEALQGAIQSLQNLGKPPVSPMENGNAA